jgi:hypothetical protein
MSRRLAQCLFADELRASEITGLQMPVGLLE